MPFLTSNLRPVLALCLLGTVFVGDRASAQCETTAFVTLPPAGLWDTLTPYAVPSDRQSDQNGFPIYNSAHPYWHDTDYAGGFLLASGLHGWDLFDVRTTARKQSPQRIYGMDGWSWTSNYPFTDPRGIPLGFVSNDQRRLAPRFWNSYGEVDTHGRDATMKEFGGKIYIASGASSGLTVWEFDPAAWASNPGTATDTGAAPEIIYAVGKDDMVAGPHFRDMHFAIAAGPTGGDRLYLYASVSSGSNRVYTFDISSAITTQCTGAADADVFLNHVRQPSSDCSPNIFKGLLTGKAHFIDTIDRQGSSPGYLAVGRTTEAEVFSLANGAAPVSRGLVRQAGDGSRLARNAAIWRTGSSIGFATVGSESGGSDDGLFVYDITNCVSGNCNGSANRVYEDTRLVTDTAKERVEAGTANGRAYLWTGQPSRCGGRSVKEVLVDVTNLSAVNDLTPALTQNIGGDVVNYFQFYYPENSSGFDWILAEGAAFDDEGYLYRSMGQIVDSHLLGDPSPSLVINGPTQTFHGDTDTYTAVPTNCTPTSGWAWSTDEDTGSNVVITNGTTATPTISWVDTGITSDTIRVTNPGCAGAEGTLSVNISDPTPQIISVSLNGTPIGSGSTVQVQQCTSAAFTTNTIGRAPLTYSWSITPAGASSSVTTLEWPVGNASTSVDQALSLGVNNASGSDSFNATLDIIEIGALGFIANPILNQVGNAASFTIDANSEGASEWRWEVAPAGTGTYTIEADFGTGVRVQPFNLATGDWDVRVTIRNCVQTGVTEVREVEDINVTSSPPSVNFTVGGPDCFLQGAFCFLVAGETAEFTIANSGGPITGYRYDFDHTGTTTSTCGLSGSTSSPIDSFTYASVGTFRPCLQVTGPGGVHLVLADKVVEVDPVAPASISVSCPSGATTGQTVTCSASATNCTASSSGWTWSTSGGTGSSNTSSIGVSWSSTGSKTVTASNSACTAVSGSDSVNVTEGGGGGGDLNAVAVITPASPLVGESVTLNGSGSTGDITLYQWSVKLNSTTLASYGTENATHVFDNPGTYTVILSVGEGCAAFDCFDDDTQTVVVGGDDLNAVAVITPAAPDAGDPVILNGSGSTGAIALYLWTVKLNSITVATYNTEIASHVFDTPGTYTVLLSVGEGCSASSCFDDDTQTVVVGGGPPLAAAFSVSPASPTQGDTVTLNGASSTGDVLEYLWTIRPPSGPAMNLGGQALLLSFDQAGTYSVTLTVHDVVGCSVAGCMDSTTQTVSVTAVEELKADIRILGADPPIAGQFFTLDGSMSTGSPTSWVWTFQGQQVPGETLTLRIDEIGDLPITLTVSNAGGSDSTSTVLQIVGDCDPSGDRLCLAGRRFKVEVDWITREGDEGPGVPFETGTPDSGLFWFFGSTNAEMLVKVLNGCAITGHFWVSVAATTDVGYSLSVTDVLTSDVYTVTNPVGQAAPAVLDTEAFATCDQSGLTQSAAPAELSYPSSSALAMLRVEAEARILAEQQQVLAESTAWAAEIAARLERESLLESEGLVGQTAEMGTCVADSETFCLLEDRFEVTVDYRDNTDATGPGVTTPFVTADSGVYYFFEANNWELLVKMVPGCIVTDHFWVFLAATTDQEFTVHVKDTITGAEKDYFNPLGTRAPAVTDLFAFPCSTP